MDTRRQRRVEIRTFSSSRRLVAAGLHAGRRLTPMYGLAEVDVTEARRLLSAHDPPWSMTAFVIASTARAAAAHPGVHAYRDWRGRLVHHDYVDISTMIEIKTSQGLFAIPHVLRDADIRDVAGLTAEIRSVKQEPASAWLERAAPVATRIPGATRAMYAVMSRSVAARKRVGTVAVTSVGMFADGGGFAITPLTVMPLQVVIGGMTRRPLVVGDRVEIRNVLDLTLCFDHTVVDGAPAARFWADLKALIESASVLS
jgi:pyruvate/2-oxoglutarate dehydrogenase complex dihydrolipoamide acyltransferase (E2) component